MSEAIVETTAKAEGGERSNAVLDALIEDFPTHLSVEQLAQLLGVRTKTAYEYLQAGDVPSYRIGKRWIILRDEIRDLLIAARVR